VGGPPPPTTGITVITSLIPLTSAVWKLGERKDRIRGVRGPCCA